MQVAKRKKYVNGGKKHKKKHLKGRQKEKKKKVCNGQQI